MIPYWAEIRHEEMWFHHHPWYALEHLSGWMNPRTGYIRGKTVGEFTEELLDGRGWQTVLGLAMVGLGIGMLIPGPLDAFAFTLGFVIGGPVMGVYFVIGYNVLAAVILLVGLGLIYFD